jgi:hypothetical protein
VNPRKNGIPSTQPIMLLVSLLFYVAPIMDLEETQKKASSISRGERTKIMMSNEDFTEV